ncbi:DUF433 domain-containing protein [Salinigranum marinum]|uniref:DUF433 domain-containing protein n=1 Tax=Salinigranum marinum TaxID=1515595 RepID=UPI002989D614|nr:DUF433 domain-containing protein [Salinigranum marinum]
MAGTGSQSSSDGTMPEIVTTDDVLGGNPRIEGHRIGVYHVYQRYVEGDDTPEDIATSYDISVAEVHAALAYAFSHPEEMRTIEAQNQSMYEENAPNRLVPDETT